MTRLTVAVLLALPVCGAAFAEHKRLSPEVHKHQQVAAASSQGIDMTPAEVRRVDRGSGVIVLRHARVRSMDLPAMTLPFRVRDAGMLDQVKAGDRIRFAAELIGDRPTITRIAR